MKTHETGHATNVANFEQLISVCTGYGTPYNPSKATLKLIALNTLLASAQTSMTNVKDKFNAYSAAVDAREILFVPLSKFITRILNALESSDVTVLKVADAKTITRKLTGKRATPKSKKTTNVVAENSISETTSTDLTNISNIPTEHKEISASQMSYDNRLDNFAKLISLLTSEPGYVPNEADLKVTALNTLLALMKTKNTTVINAITALSNSRINRNKILYHDATNMYDITVAAKAYVKSVFGAISPEYKQISKIRFTKPR